jgi:hypothetical protein
MVRFNYGAVRFNHRSSLSSVSFNLAQCGNLDWVLSGLPHIGNNDTISRAEAVVFVAHNQFVVKPE